jgi:hypothetical protein
MSFNLTPKRSRLVTKSQPLELDNSREGNSSLTPWSQIINPKSVKNSKTPKLAQSLSPSSSKLSRSVDPKLRQADPKSTSKNQSKLSTFSRFDSQRFMNEIFAGSAKPEESNKDPKSKTLTSTGKLLDFQGNLGINSKFSKTFNKSLSDLHESSEISKTSDNFYVNQSGEHHFHPESPVGESRLIQKSFEGSKSLKIQKSAPNNLKVAEKISKDFSLVFRKKDSRILEKEQLLEEIRVKDAENAKAMHFIHETMNRVHGLKVKLASKDSTFSPLAKSSTTENKSIFDLKARVNDDLDRVITITDKILSELTEMQDLKKREKDLKRNLNEAHEREVFLQTKIELEKNKAFELANSNLDSQKVRDRKELAFTRERLEFQQKICDLENELVKVVKEKDLALRSSRDYNLQTEKFSFYARNMEVELVKAKEQVSRYQKDVEVLREKLKNKEINEELLTLKLKNYEENANYETKSLTTLNEKISELEEQLRLKNSELTELKYKQCLSLKSSVIEDLQGRSSKLMTRIQEITNLTQETSTPSENLIKSQSKEIKKLKITLDLLQKENSMLSLSKQQTNSLENDKEDLASKLSESENKLKLLEKENLRLKSELLTALDYVESAEKSSINISQSAKIQKEQIKNLLESKDSMIEESLNMKQMLDLRDERIEKLKKEVKDLQKTILENDIEIDKLKNEANRLKSASASQELGLAFQQEKENAFKSQLQDCVLEMKQIKLESKKLKEENFKQTQEITRKNFEIQELHEIELKLRDQIIENVSEIQKINKNFKECREICESQENLIKVLNQEKKEIQEKFDKLVEISQRIEENRKELENKIKDKEEELEIYHDQEGKIMSEIQEIENEIKKIPRRNSLKPSEEIRLINEEKFRLRSLLVYKNAQIKMLKEKNTGGKSDVEEMRQSKRHKSLLGPKIKKG